MAQAKIIKLTFPEKSHTTEDLRPLYEEFKEQYPDHLSQWKRLEGKGHKLGPEDLKPVQQEVCLS